MMDPAVDDEAAQVLRHERVTHFLSGDELKRRSALRGAMVELRTLATQLGARAVLCGRIKSISSISDKMLRMRLEPHQIFDIIGVRVITNCAQDCYRLSQMIHKELDVLEGAYDDYIAEPKPNGYQSIHTTLVGQHGFPVEIQIRTRSMHTISERGSARRPHRAFPSDGAA